MASFLESNLDVKQIINFEFMCYMLILLAAGMLVAKKLLIIDLFKFIPGIFYLYILIAIAVIYFLFKRNYYLPFLGRTVYPCDNISETIPNYIPGYPRKTKNVQTKYLNKKIIYWAAMPGKNTKKTPEDAYKNFENQGIAKSNNKGKVTFTYYKPVGYFVNRFGFEKELKPHIHYRACLGNGMLSQIERVDV
tara:strand:- start:197 stop:772 length:576 start_codon:yes stop_codon:yes gene_type:complete